MTIFNAQISVASENSLIVYFGEDAGKQVSQEVTEQIQTVKALLENELAESIVELIPSYASLLITFDPYQTDHYAIRQLLNNDVYKELNNTDLNSNQKGVTKTADSKLAGSSLPKKTAELPVYYGEEVGPDLQRIADNAQISVEEVIRLHQAQTYRVFAIGFAPGFGYLGQVDEKIAMPRLSSPRSLVPKGAVAIADRQTAIYPAASPGGWNIIGRCPIDMFTPDAEPAMPFDVGYEIRFKAIDKQEFIALGGEV